MTDNQDPLTALKTLIENKENLSPPTAKTTSEANLKQNGEPVLPEGLKVSTSGELTQDQQAAQQTADLVKDAELKTKLKEHEAEQVAKDQEAIQSLRGELPEFTATNSTETGSTNISQDINGAASNDQITQNVVHEVEQLTRLD